ncbi:MULTISPECIES: acyloxyacyl hydrolase [unclassified Pseudoalteromonas]|uniref:acyloxyacyl hydrolase n=1 Tax=unclassified Pseudoalteromonas TaxID=194690 RepID=UPI000CF6EB59|nr:MULTISPECIES: acyloxyacyl hydrolase [unclassified Pseudoalteromonas]
MKRTIPSVALLALVTLPAFADDDTSSVSIGVASWAVFDQFDIFAVHADYEHRPLQGLWDLQPRVLVILAEHDQKYYGIGAAKAFKINDDWSWGVASHVGYAHNLDSLGYDLEFYSYLFTKYKITQEHRVRAEVGHISNAGFGETNPGSESIVMSYSYHF